jgi:hypothetical protein
LAWVELLSSLHSTGQRRPQPATISRIGAEECLHAISSSIPTHSNSFAAAQLRIYRLFAEYRRGVAGISTLHGKSLRLNAPGPHFKPHLLK